MIEVNSASYTFASSGSAFTGVTTTGTWAWSAGDSGRVQTTAVSGTKTLAVDTGFRSHKVVFTLGSGSFSGAANGISLFCSGSSSSAANAVFLDIKLVGTEYYFTLRAAGTNITKDSDAAQSYVAEYPFNPPDLSTIVAYGGPTQFELSFGKYGWRARYYDALRVIWITIAELPLYIPNNHSVSAGSQTRQYLRASTNTWAGVVVTSSYVTSIADIQVYQIAEYGNTQSVSTLLFDDPMTGRTENPYIPTNNSVGNAYYTTGTAILANNIYLYSPTLTIASSPRGYGTIAQYNASGSQISKFPSVSSPAEYPTSMLKFTYESGQLGVHVGGEITTTEAGPGPSWKTLWFNSNLSGSTYAVTWEDQTTFKDASTQANVTTYAYPANSGGSPLLVNGDIVWIVIYPTLSTTYPSDSATAYTLRVYKQSTKPTISSTHIFSYTASDYFMYGIGLANNAGAARIKSLSYSLESADVFTGVETATPLVLTSSTTLQLAPSTTSTELVGGVYLGTDYAYQITETT